MDRQRLISRVTCRWPARAALACALVASIAAPASAQPANTQPSNNQPAKRAAPAEALVISGAYELTNDAGTRRCLVLLRPSDAPGGYAIGFPAQCRMALPALQKVQAWTMETMARAPRARIKLIAADGAMQLDFSEEGPNGAGQARDGAGQIYHLRPTQGSSLATRVESLVGARPAPPVAYAPPPPDTGAMARATGNYGFIRSGERDTGCVVTLEGAGPAAVDGLARITSGCADKGITFFNPKAWNIANETLWLIGSRGRISFERNRKNGWDKAPGQGEPLHLRKQ